MSRYTSVPDIAGWSSLVARRAHNPEVVGSNPAPATKNLQLGSRKASELFYAFSQLRRRGAETMRLSGQNVCLILKVSPVQYHENQYF